MEQEPEASAAEAMAFGLIQQANELTRSARETQQALVEQIQELVQLKDWAVQAAVELKKQADAGVLNSRQQTAASVERIEAERVQLQNVGLKLEQAAGYAIQAAVRKHGEELGQQTGFAMAQPIHDIQQAAAQVRQNVKKMRWFLIGLILSGGMVIGLLAGYWPLRSSQNNMQEQLNRSEQYLAAQQQPVPAPGAPDLHSGGRKGKAK